MSLRVFEIFAPKIWIFDILGTEILVANIIIITPLYFLLKPIRNEIRKELGNFKKNNSGIKLLCAYTERTSYL